MTRSSLRLGAALGSALVLALALVGCGAEGDPAPRVAAPETRCATLDESTATLRTQLDAGALPGLAEVVSRLAVERSGALIEAALDVFFRIVASLPREETTSFEYDKLRELLTLARPQLVSVLEYLAGGDDSRADVLRLLRDGVVDCPRDSFVLTLRDVFEATELLGALGAALDDSLVVSLLRDIPGQEAGERGFVAVLRLVFNAIASPSFDIAELRSILAFADLDRPPLSDAFAAAEAYLQPPRVDHLVATLACITETRVGERDGVEVLGTLLYGLITDENVDAAEFLVLAAPIIAELQEPDIQLLGGAIIDGLVDDLTLREAAIELVAFVLRDDNLPLLVADLPRLVADRGADDLVAVIEAITVRCPE